MAKVRFNKRNTKKSCHLIYIDIGFFTEKNNV